MHESEFSTTFKLLTGNLPFPWQWELYDKWFRNGNFPPSCNLPTGLGKTSVIAVWLIALATRSDKMPRRLVYVVNRRTVVDQTTEEVEKYRRNLRAAGLWESLVAMSGVPLRGEDCPLAISTLRGQFADNREWSADPSRPAVISGTVDMIGSRLLFSGYGVGMKGRPLHAGFLGQDVLLVHDEAHLEPSFQDLVKAIENEQKRCKEFRTFRVMELTATPRGEGKVFELTEKEKNPDEPRPDQPTEPIHHVWRRTHASKALDLRCVTDEKKELVPTIAKRALDYKDAEAKPAVLIFVRTVQAVDEVVAALKKGKVDTDNIQTLTGTMRGRERDQMATESRVFARFGKGSPAEPRQGTVYLVCTSAGEVGVDMSADHLICDLSTYESMAQRFGRVNRYGDGAARIDVIYPAKFETKDKPLEAARERTYGLLDQLRRRLDDFRDASPASLSELLERAICVGSSGSNDSVDRTKALRESILSAFAPPPAILPVTDILFDAWALTTIRDKLPGRPEVEPYLHGITDDDFTTEFAWREEVALVTGKVETSAIEELLDNFPLKSHETLRVPTFGKRGSAAVHLAAIAERKPNLPAWVIDPDGELAVFEKLAELAKDVREERRSLAERTVVLPPSAGALTANGTLNGDEKHDPDRDDYDVAGRPPAKVDSLLRFLVTPADDGAIVSTVARIEKWPITGDIECKPGEKPLVALNKRLTLASEPRVRTIFTLDIPAANKDDDSSTSEYLIVRAVKAVSGETPTPEWPALTKHLGGVRQFAEKIVSPLNLDKKLTEAVLLAATWHDLGKERAIWQRGAGNVSGFIPVAKTLHGRPPENLNHYRHELGSMVDVLTGTAFAEKFDALEEWRRDVVLHLIATHHGRGRPHFREDESDDPDRAAAVVSSVVADTPGRFARLQRRFGRWGLAYLESLLRAADILESQRIEAAPLPDEWPKGPAASKPILRPLRLIVTPEPSITVAVDPTNPGQFFACCGLLELADRLWPEAEGWFAEDGREFKMACGGTLPNLVDAIANAKLIHDDPGDPYSSPLTIADPFRPLCVDWWETDRTGAKDLKVWAGTMESYGIARAMQFALRDERFHTPTLFDEGGVVANPDDQGKKKEPYYYDARRAPNAHARDVGFSTNDLQLTSTAFPAVEFLCLIGLQVARPAFTEQTRIYDYFLWPIPLLPSLMLAASTGELRLPGQRGFRFENWFRTGQRKHKAFRSAIPLPHKQGD